METNNLKYLEFLTQNRFEKTRTETIEALKIIEDNNLSEKNIIEGINEEDILILIKMKTFKKNIRNFILAFVIIVISIFLKFISPLFLFLIIIGTIVLISSLFGIIYNRISKNKKRYITN